MHFSKSCIWRERNRRFRLETGGGFIDTCHPMLQCKSFGLCSVNNMEDLQEAGCVASHNTWEIIFLSTSPKYVSLTHISPKNKVHTSVQTYYFLSPSLFLYIHTYTHTHAHIESHTSEASQKCYGIWPYGIAKQNPSFPFPTLVLFALRKEKSRI